MMRKKRAEEEIGKKRIIFIIFALIIVIIIISLLNILVKSFEFPLKEQREYIVKEQENSLFYEEKNNNFVSLGDSRRVEMYLPAVNSEGAGVNTILTVEAMPGSGRTLTDIDNLLFWADTQHSMRVARRVAENFTGKKVEDYDIVYTIQANASLIGGPSAGAALAITTIAALENKNLKKNVMITGGINHDGTISPVSSILEKAQAAKKTGATLFLVPLLQSRDVVYQESEHCEVFGYTEVCTTVLAPKSKPYGCCVSTRKCSNT